MTLMSPKQSQHTGCPLSRENGLVHIFVDNNIPLATIVSFSCFSSVFCAFIGSI